MAEIARVEVGLDDKVPEYMDGVLRSGSVQSFDAGGALIQDHQELIDNTPYHSEEELRQDIATRLGVDTEIVEIIG